MPRALPAGTRVLIVDDDALSREVLGLVAEDLGCAVTLVCSGDAAVEHVRGLPPEQLPECILADLQMPGLAGGALANTLRALLPAAARVFAISATMPTPAETADFDEMLLKPISLQTLERILVQPAPVEGELQATRTVQAAEVPVDETVDAEAVALSEGTYRSIASAMTPGQVRELYDMCLTDAERRIGQMQSASAAGDRDSFIRLAHAIKGGCGMVGAVELASLASGFEEEGPPEVDDLVPFERFLAASRRLRSILNAQTG